MSLVECKIDEPCRMALDKSREENKKLKSKNQDLKDVLFRECKQHASWCDCHLCKFIERFLNEL